MKTCKSIGIAIVLALALLCSVAVAFADVNVNVGLSTKDAYVHAMNVYESSVVKNDATERVVGEAYIDAFVAFSIYAEDRLIALDGKIDDTQAIDRAQDWLERERTYALEQKKNLRTASKNEIEQIYAERAQAAYAWKTEILPSLEITIITENLDRYESEYMRLLSINNRLQKILAGKNTEQEVLIKNTNEEFVHIAVSIRENRIFLEGNTSHDARLLAQQKNEQIKKDLVSVKASLRKVAEIGLY